MIICKTPREIEIMREAGRIVALTHQELKSDLRAYLLQLAEQLKGSH